jgi:hypothetical protein
MLCQLCSTVWQGTLANHFPAQDFGSPWSCRMAAIIFMVISSHFAGRIVLAGREGVASTPDTRDRHSLYFCPEAACYG